MLGDEAGQVGDPLVSARLRGEGGERGTELRLLPVLVQHRGAIRHGVHEIFVAEGSSHEVGRVEKALDLVALTRVKLGVDCGLRGAESRGARLTDGVRDVRVEAREVRDRIDHSARGDTTRRGIGVALAEPGTGRARIRATKVQDWPRLRVGRVLGLDCVDDCGRVGQVALDREAFPVVGGGDASSGWDRLAIEAVLDTNAERAVVADRIRAVRRARCSAGAPLAAHTDEDGRLFIHGVEVRLVDKVTNAKRFISKGPVPVERDGEPVLLASALQRIEVVSEASVPRVLRKHRKGRQVRGDRDDDETQHVGDVSNVMYHLTH